MLHMPIDGGMMMRTQHYGARYTMSAVALTAPSPAETLTKAVLRAGKGLGLSQEAVGRVVGRDRSALYRKGLDPSSKPGELGLLLVRLYRSLYPLVGGDEVAMRHWMRSFNRDTGGVPAEQVEAVQGLTRVVEYLDAMRGRA